MARELASALRVTVVMGANFGHGEDCSEADWGLCHTQKVALDYAGDEEYRNPRFRIFFSSIHRVLQVNHPDFQHGRVLGDLTYLEPRGLFYGFQPKTRSVIPLVLEYWSVQETDNMPRWFVVDDRDGSTAVIRNTNTEDIRRFVVPYTSAMKTADDANVHMTAETRFSSNEETVAEVDARARIIPAPYFVNVADDAQTFDVAGVYLENWQSLGKLRIGATDMLWKLGLGGGLSGARDPHRVSFYVGPLPDSIDGPESYVMEVTAGGTTITGTEASGLFHGLVSLLGLLDVADGAAMTLTEMTVYDGPRFGHRGHQVDVARNFRSKEAIMRTIDAMALWKLNVLHLALTNDEGWRLEIPGLWELTSVGSRRCFDPNEDTCLLTQLGSGPDAEEQQYYTRQDYIELLKYAEARDVKILPEFNMPAHARAAVISMEARARNVLDDSYRLIDPEDETYLLTVQFYDRTSIINPCLDSSVRFVRKVVEEVSRMHDEAGVPLDSYHFGGDEAKNILLGAGYMSYPDELKQQPFSKSPACQAKAQEDPSFDIGKIANYWAVAVNEILAEYGIREMHAWEDGLRGTSKEQYQTESVAVDFWETLFWGGIEGLVDIADDGFDIIMSNPDYLYFDFPHEVNPEERGYYWAARFNSVYKVFTFAPENLAQNAETSLDRDGNGMSIATPDAPKPVIRGMQGQTWSETIRTDEQYYEMAFPRVLAVAERAWHRATWELEWSPGVEYNATTGRIPMDHLASDYNDFASALGCREVSKLEKLGIAYRVPPPGASIDASGIVTANSELPCTVILYSVDKENFWQKYSGPFGVAPGTVVSLQSVSPSGVLKSRVVVIDEELCTDCGNGMAPETNPRSFYCGYDPQDALENMCVPCPSGDVAECGNRFHGCIEGVSECNFFVPEIPQEETYLAWDLAPHLRVIMNMGKNFGHSADCSMGDWQLCHTQDLILEYTGKEDYLNVQFKIYFSSIHRVLQVNHPDFEFEHVVGDLTFIKPADSFPGFQPQTRLVLPLVLEYWSVQETDNMPRWFVVDDRDQSTAVIRNTNTEDMHSFVVPYTNTMKTATDANIEMTTANRFSLNRKTVTEVDASTRIIPKPHEVIVENGAETFTIDGIALTNHALLGDLRIGATYLLWKLDLNRNGNHIVQFKLDPLPSPISGPEAYRMEVSKEGTTITGIDTPGLFHGFMSFIGLLDITNSAEMTLKEMRINDEPRFDYRGHQVDVARNFRSKRTIMQTIDAMALLKLNVLHLALTNDEGWRLEIPGLEELTIVGSKRCFDPNEETCLLTQLGSGPDAKKEQYYSRVDYIDLLKYARERNVKILPEFNMPAHARAAVIAMEARAKKGDGSYRLTDPEDETYLLTIQFYDRTSIINPCLDSSVKFVRKVVEEVKRMHDEAGVPLDSYHFGGDEAKNILLGSGYSSYPEELKQQPFSKSPACQAKAQADPSFDMERIANYWAITVNKILAENGIKEMVAWEDGLRGTSKEQYQTQSVAVNFWETLFWGGINGLADIADDGFDIIMSNPDYLYFDFPHEVNPEERGYYWAARFNSVYKVFTFAPENLAQNAETSTDRDGNDMSVTTPMVSKPIIRGMQGQTWSETIRTDEQFYEMTFPRVLAVAERAWHRASWELEWSPGVEYSATTDLIPKADLASDYNSFASAVGCREVLKLEKLGIVYRVPPPGASIDASGILTANSELPCTIILYTVDEGKSWSKYFGPIDVGSGTVVTLQSVSLSGTLKSRVVVADEECSDCGNQENEDDAAGDTDANTTTSPQQPIDDAWDQNSEPPPTFEGYSDISDLSNNGANIRCCDMYILHFSLVAAYWLVLAIK